ncbi:DNA polymerase III subunit chi [Ramlibacter solisilvae]|uniref:DNA polymerase III subunit chi n=1 Tax=Ramlibacter tataouinensis TaxID=94132 RepID=A0A127JY95_9BURK|nr:DNA polymerase III subunit chi [Ramlibacter tataouinensis]AMO24968.1 DNA polymerase III subunit chi [Ramlibacter tataouinensis]
MTGVEFHFNAPDKLGYACRLLRKAAAKGARVTVTGRPPMLRELDTALWTFSPLDFVAHCQAAGAPQAVLAASPIVLCDSPRASPHHQVLLNLGDDVPEGFERFERLIEVVSLDEDDRARARVRWKHYASRGYELKREDLVLKEPS